MSYLLTYRASHSDLKKMKNELLIRKLVMIFSSEPETSFEKSDFGFGKSSVELIERYLLKHGQRSTNLGINGIFDL